jgi:dolichyl-diphosphooligosaccharide--protein glycosyltransferase
MAYKNIKRAYYPLARAGLGILAIVFLYIIDPSLYHAAVAKIRQVFFPSGAAQTIGEVQSMLSIDGFGNMIYFFTTGIIFALMALSFLIYGGIKNRRWESTILFLVIWCLMMLLAMLGQNRFAYYFAVNVALLSGYVCWNILEWSRIYFREALPEREQGKGKVTREGEPEARSAAARYNVEQLLVAVFRFFIYNPKYSERFKEKKAEREISRRMLEGEREEVSRIPSHFRAWHGMAGVSIIVFLVAFVPNIAVTMFDVRDTSAGINEAWYSSLVWMRENTPDPFENPDFYYEVYERPSSGESYDYPDSAYGVMNVWTSGHWITRIAHRIPNSNPFQSGAGETSRYFVTQNESDANRILDRLESKYVITDITMATVKFESISLWGGVSEVTYWDLYYEDPANGGQGFITLYYPEYYQSMSVRLYTFGGEAVVPSDSTFVVSYEERSQLLSGDYKEITSIQSFATYDKAQEFLESQTNLNYRIVGMSPYTSAVPLDELEHYRLVHQSDPEIHLSKKGEPLPWVKIFEYIP